MTKRIFRRGGVGWREEAKRQEREELYYPFPFP